MGRPETWQTTDLWNALESREDEGAAAARLTVLNILPEVEEILAKGNSTPKTYTLHDEEHSHRVAQLIANIAGDQLQLLSAYEVALLLLAAYLHDIGMTPPAGKVAAHYSYLLSGEASDLSDGQREELQVFLDDHWDGRVPPLSSSTPTPEEIALAGRIAAAYVRDRHNSWGAEWMRKNLQARADDLYAGWLDDLILLCASHHYGIDELLHSDFNPRLVDNEDRVCHLRFCACLLRVADVLDFDPERTPKVLFVHRDVDDGSIIHWHKNHGIGFSLSGDEITVHAQPSDSVTHHAVVCTVEEAERELLLCDRLDQETQFNRMQGWAEDLPHEWRLRTHVQRQINPRGNCYEYVDGTFRPDPGRVLDLIGGVELYGDSLVSARELLQNAFDAVREQIARERLEQPEPGDEATLARLAKNHHVLLKLEKDDAQVRLVCRDSGSGMTKNILLSRFLVGGKTANHEIRDLERRCRKKGFSVGRTARFGIGVLSYFLLAKRLQLDTRRSIEAGGTEGAGWSFSSNGLEDFGEVSANSECPQGTTVTLTIREAFLHNGYEDFADRLRDYLLETVRRVPCDFRFEVESAGVEEITFSPGWTGCDSEVRALLLQDLDDPIPDEINTPLDLLSEKDREGVAQQDAYWEAIRSDAENSICVSSEEGDLPEGLGTYRIFTCCFDLLGHLSVPFLDLYVDDDGTTQIEMIGERADMYSCPAVTLTSWNGMEVESEFDDEPLPSFEMPGGRNSVMEIDWTSDAAGRLAVDRNHVQLSQKGKEALQFVGRQARDLLAATISRDKASPFALINARLTAAKGPEEDADMQWIVNASGRHLRPIPFPVRDKRTYGNRELESRFQFQGKKITPVRGVTVIGGHGRNVDWHGSEYVPSRIAFTPPPEVRPIAIWDGPRRADPNLPIPQSRALQFPDQCKQWIGVSGEGVPTWNRRHPLIQTLDRESWKWAAKIRREDRDPLSYAGEMLGSPARAAAWIVYFIWVSEKRLWNGLVDRDPKFLESLWELIDGLAPEETLYFFNEQFVEQEVRIVGPASWEVLKGPASTQWLGEATAGVDESWWLTPMDPASDAPG
jgi:hypothetical protein